MAPASHVLHVSQSRSGVPEAPGALPGSSPTQPHPCTEVGCPPGRLYRECQQGEGCPYSCAHLAGRIACFPGGCQEGCHCPAGTLLHHGHCLQVSSCTRDPVGAASSLCTAWLRGLCLVLLYSGGALAWVLPGAMSAPCSHG